MPNWCNNYLQIEGSPKELSKLMKQVEITKSEATSEHSQSLFSCHQVIPRPDNQSANWYEWNIAHWGSKWDLSDVHLEDTDWEKGAVAYSFQTAWSPVIEVIHTLSQQYKKLSFKYEFWESGADFWGVETYDKGVVTDSQSGDLSSAGCEKLEELMGQHHYCSECYDYLECEKENTKEICESCEADTYQNETSLWEGENNGSSSTDATLENA